MYSLRHPSHGFSGPHPVHRWEKKIEVTLTIKHHNIDIMIQRLYHIQRCLFSVEPGCGGGGAKVQSESQIKTTTLGQELMDLVAAYEKGVMTDTEYEKAKKELLKKYQ